MIADLEKRNAALALWRKWYEAAQALDAADGTGIDDAAFEELEKAVDDAYAAYGEVMVALLQNWAGDDIERCAITDVPLRADDDIVMVLRAALPGAKEKAA